MAMTDYVTFHGDPYALAGTPVEVGTPARDFTLIRFQDGQQGSFDLQHLLASGKPSLISVITSVDTPVGSLQAKTFDDLLVPHVPRVNGLLVSSDLPFTLNRFHGGRYGVLIEDPRILARAVFVLDAAGVVRYVEIVPEITNEPDYGSALATLVNLL